MSIDKFGGAVACTVYINNKLVAEGVQIELPEVSNKTVTYQAMGDADMVMPITDAMEATITFIGTDRGLLEALRENTEFECRWVEKKTTPLGGTVNVGNKAFLTGGAKSFPALSVQPGESVEVAIPLAVLRYTLFSDGEEVLCVDKNNFINRVNGVDLLAEVKTML